jgi:hypothetical protein
LPHFGPFDLAMAYTHKFFFQQSTPDIYGRYYREKATITTTEEYLRQQKAQKDGQVQNLLESCGYSDLSNKSGG